MPFARAETIRDNRGAPLRVIPGGDHRLQSIDRSAQFKRFRQTLSRG